VSVCLFVRALKGERHELSTSSLVDIVHNRPLVFTDYEVKRSKVKVRGLSNTLPESVSLDVLVVYVYA